VSNLCSQSKRQAKHDKRLSIVGRGVSAPVINILDQPSLQHDHMSWYCNAGNCYSDGDSDMRVRGHGSLRTHAIKLLRVKICCSIAQPPPPRKWEVLLPVSF
jgi:hypothetical protein